MQCLVWDDPSDIQDGRSHMAVMVEQEQISKQSEMRTVLHSRIGYNCSQFLGLLVNFFL